MALIEINRNVLSDLVVNEFDPSVGRARRVINVTTTKDLPMGTLVFREKDGLDLDAPYTPVTDAATQLVATNELAVVFGDKYSCKEVVEAGEDGVVKAVAFVGFDVILKDKMVLEVNKIERDSEEHKALKALLERQDIILAETMNVISAK